MIQMKDGLCLTQQDGREFLKGHCPPHYKNMRDAVEALARRKLGEGGVYNPNTPGAWTDSPKIRGSAAPYTEEFKECVALQAQYIYDTYGKFPGTIQTIFVLCIFRLSI